MLDFLDDSSGERLALRSYRDDYNKRISAAAGSESWKFERQQHFREPGFASWEAFARGDWDRSLELIENERKGLEELARQAADEGLRLLRVRVVEEPIDPYLQWELHLLRIRAEYGEEIRVIGPERISQFEADGPLPELLTIGSDTLYRILYDGDGILDGGVRFTDRVTVTRATAFIESLYEAGEDMGSYFQRKIAWLEPPSRE
jgi:hypothetical protein